MNAAGKILLGSSASSSSLCIVVGAWSWGTLQQPGDPPAGDRRAWAQVQNVYQRRADLVPNLVNTVAGAANFEKSTLTAVTDARASVGRVQLPSSGAADRPGAARRVRPGPGPARVRPLAAPRRLRELPQPDGDRQFPGPAGPARGHRKPDLRRAQPVQRGRPGL